jgi:hypothetical protein
VRKVTVTEKNFYYVPVSLGSLIVSGPLSVAMDISIVSVGEKYILLQLVDE